jgi:hypothetical protein
MRHALNSFIYSFPVQLIALHLKRNHFLILFLLFLTGMITNVLGARYGISLLFLDPEYLGRVDFSSFCILGAAYGAFIMVWHVTSYILNAHNFSFLATLKKPFSVYCINNSAMPLLFLIIYIFEITAFQAKDGLLDVGKIGFRIGGFLAGMFAVILITMVYFFRTNKDIFQIVGIIEKKKERAGLQRNPDELKHTQSGYREAVHAEYYLSSSLRWKLTRSADHYHESVIRHVYRQHHSNALFIELTALFLLLLLSILMDYPVFRIPAAASIFLLCVILTVLIGAFSYWLKQWKLLFLILLIIIIDVMMHSDLLTYRNKAYGLSYAAQPDYSIDKLKTDTDSSHVSADKQNTLQILNNWKNKFPAGAQKPKMVFLNCSGGGLRSMAFVMQVLQTADSATNGKLMFNCPLITGASGGMVAAAYYRELYLRNYSDTNINLSDAMYLDNISSDMLNAICFTTVVNDLFYPWQEFTYNNQSYRKDRGYMFEKILNENTDSILSKSIGAYKQDEFNMRIPMMIFYPTIINDERKLYISTQGVSYLALPSARTRHFSKPEIDGVDYRYLLPDNNPDSLLFTTALRMNCTFPYILPNVHLPTNPAIELMDAGIRDNFGVETSVRFIENFKDWIMENTSGVIVVNIRSIEQVVEIKKDLSVGVFEKFFTPIGNLYVNWIEIQDYQHDFLLNYLDELLNGNLEVITLEYQPSGNNKRASLSFHLTNREKRDIAAAVNNVYNAEAYRKLKELLVE